MRRSYCLGFMALLLILAQLFLVSACLAQGQVWQETRITGSGSFPGPPKIWGSGASTSVWWRDDRSYFSGYDEIRQWTPGSGETVLTQIPLNANLQARYGDEVVYRTDINTADLYLWDPVRGHRAITTAAGSQYGADLYQDTVVYEDHSGSVSQVKIWDPVNGERAVYSSNSEQSKPKIWGNTVTWEQATSGTPHVWKYDPVGGAVDLGAGYSPAVYDGKVVGWQPAWYSNGSLISGHLWQWTAAGGKVNLAAIPWTSSLYGCEMWGDIITMQLGDGNPIWNLYAWDPVHGMNRVNDTSVYGSFPSVYGNQIAWVGGHNIYLSSLIPEPSGIAGLSGFLGLLGLSGLTWRRRRVR